MPCSDYGCMQPACRLHAGCMQAAFERMQPAYARMQAAFARIFSWPSVFCPAYFGKIRPDLACEITAYFARRIFLFLEWPDQSAITCIISYTNVEIWRNRPCVFGLLNGRKLSVYACFG